MYITLRTDKERQNKQGYKLMERIQGEKKQVGSNQLTN